MGPLSQCPGTWASSPSPAQAPPPNLLGEDAWLCALSAPQPGIRDLAEEKREGGLVADLGNTKGLCSKGRHVARPRAAELQLPEMSREAAGLTLWAWPWAIQERR